MLLVLGQEARQAGTKVAAVSQLVPVLVGDCLGDLDRRVEVPVASRELAALLQIDRLLVERSERAKLFPQFLLAVLQSLGSPLL